MISEIRHIQAFLTVARHRNFTRAAHELHLSQSALTVQIQQFEAAMGVRLFDRNKRRVALTDIGRTVLSPLERIVAETEAVVSQTRDIAGLRRGQVAVAVLPTMAQSLFPLALKEFTGLHPGIEVQIRDLVSERIIESVIREEVDFGIGSLIRPFRELTSTTITTDELCAYVPTGHPLAKEKAVTIHQLAKHPLILMGRDSSVRGLLETALRKSKVQITPAYDSNYLSTAMALVRNDLGVGILPDLQRWTGPSEGVLRIPIWRPTIGRKIQILRKTGRSASPSAEKLMKVLQECARRLG